MLRNIFPVEKALRKLNASHGITAHDDLVSIICVENESIEKSILFQSLVTNNRDGCCVVYVTKEPFDVLPEPVEDMPSADPLYMDAVTFIYMNNAQQLTSYLAELHTMPMLPNVLILQNISFYTGQYKGDSFNTKCTRLLALIKETAKFLATKMENVGEAKLFITMRPCQEDLAIFKKHFKHFWFIKETSIPSEYMVKLQKGSSDVPGALTFQSLIDGICNVRFTRDC